MEENSRTAQPLVLVDLYDRPTGYMEKMETHRKGMLHRAVSVFLFHPHGEWLLQRRAFAKYHSGGLWSNACCTHPYPDEDPATAAGRRLKEELGLSCPLEKLFCFVYKAQLDQGLTEHEYDHVYIGTAIGLPQINPEEVREWGYFSTTMLTSDLKTHPGNYTAWFQQLFPEILKRI